MLQTKDPLNEDRLLLNPNDRTGRFDRFPHLHCEVAIVKGAAYRLERWPSHIYFAFLAACLVIAGLMLFVFATASLYLPDALEGRCRGEQNYGNVSSFNVYFVKHENHTWTAKEFCYIEAAARENPELNINIINLMDDKFAEEYARAFVIQLREVKEDTEEYESISVMETENDSTKMTEESQLRKALGSSCSNIRNIDVTAEQFFQGTKLSNVIPFMDSETLVFAAKAYLLWNSPGITLDPTMYCNIKYIRQLLYENHIPDMLTTIDVKNDLQATRVPCQVFMGFLIRELSDLRRNKFSSERYTVEKALADFCPRTQKCPEIRTFHSTPKCSLSVLKCPVTYSKEMRQLWNYKDLVAT